jgi:transcriptional regulator of acetoin/glycerol metabolism
MRDSLDSKLGRLLQDTIQSRDVHVLASLIDLPHLAALIARHALIHGGRTYGAELRALVLSEMVRQSGDLTLAAKRYGVSRNTVYKAIETAKIGKKRIAP